MVKNKMTNKLSDKTKISLNKIKLDFAMETIDRLEKKVAYLYQFLKKDGEE